MQNKFLRLSAYNYKARSTKPAVSSDSPFLTEEEREVKRQEATDKAVDTALPMFVDVTKICLIEDSSCINDAGVDDSTDVHPNRVKITCDVANIYDPVHKFVEGPVDYVMDMVAQKLSELSDE